MEAVHVFLIELKESFCSHVFTKHIGGMFFIVI